MDVEMEDYVEDEEEEEECYEPLEIDPDYEFDASHFFDFTRLEKASEAIEAERWFEVSGHYPPSPFIAKSKWGSEFSVEQEKTTGTSSDSNISQETPQAKSKSTTKSTKQRSSTLMKPTASHLAKLNHAQSVYSTHFCGRLQKASTKSDEHSLQSSSGSDHLATKRQKLEIGYLCKVAHLKHQALLLHKISKKGGPLVIINSVNSKLKVTVPKEPELETLRRARIRRSKNDLQSSENEKQKTDTFIKARSLNKEIHEACMKPQPKKSKQKLPGLQAFHLKTMEREMQHTPVNVSSHDSANSVLQNTTMYSKRPKAQSSTKQEESGKPAQAKSRLANKESKCSNNERLLLHPPTELFNKMSLVTNAKNTTKSQPKLHLSDKKNVGKPNHNGVERGTSKIGCHPSINRRLGVR